MARMAVSDLNVVMRALCRKADEVIEQGRCCCTA